MKPTILFVAGLARFLDQFVSPLAQALREEGFRTVAAAGSMVRLAGFDQCYELPHFRRGSAMDVLRAQRALVAIGRQERPALVHLHTPPGIALGRIAGLVLRIPSISIVHTTFLEPLGKRAIVFGVIEGILARVSVITVTMNRDDAGFYRRICREGSVYVAPVGGIGLDLARLQQASIEPAILEPRPSIVVVGRLTPEKNLDLIVEAFDIVRARSPSASLWFIGSAHRGDRPWTVPQRPGIHHVEWQSDPFTLLAGSDLLVSASRREGFGLVVAEALAMGIPVAAVPSRGVREIQRHAPDLVHLAQSKPQSMAKAIWAAMDADSSARLRPQVAASWSRETSVAFHISLMKQVLGSPAAPSEAMPCHNGDRHTPSARSECDSRRRAQTE